MKNQTQIIEWATGYLCAKGYTVHHSKIILQTPWSEIVRFSTSKGDIYLKQVPTAIASEPMILKVLADQFKAHVPLVIAINKELHCFLMHDGGQNLREHLKAEFQPNLLCEAITRYTAIQRSTENHVQIFFGLGVPDWRLDKLSFLYDQVINQVALLKSDGLTDKEIQVLHDLGPRFSEQCELLSQYRIPETIAIYDFNTNNVLINPKTNQMNFIDWGESVITHPFFSLHTYLHQATLHHSVKESDPIYSKLQEVCIENWLELARKEQIIEAFDLAKQFWPIYSIFSIYRLINIIGLEAFNRFYANRPHRIRNFFKDYIQSCSL